MNVPYLSVVAASRNDDHGGNLLARMQIFIDGILHQASGHSLPTELIIVEWNPPPDREPLADALRWPERHPDCSVRLIQVPREVHDRFAHSDRLPFFQMIAKNAGIRRARAPFVLATNIDILFNDALCHRLAQRQLGKDEMYRIDRYDVDPYLPAGTPTEEQLQFCSQHVIRVNRRHMTVDVRTGEVFGEDPIGRRKTTAYVADALRRTFPRRWLHSARDLLPGAVRRNIPAPIEHGLVHTNACGDFTLLPKERWFELRAYPELEMFSMHLDSLLCWAAYYGGARHIELTDPHRIYHLEHPGGWNPEVATDQSLDQRLEALGIPRITENQYPEMLEEMRITRKPMIFNDASWGLVDEELPEIETVAVS